MELAISALENDVEGPRVAEVAMPHNQGAIRLDHLEGVRAVALDSHREMKWGGVRRQWACEPPAQARGWLEEVGRERLVEDTVGPPRGKEGGDGAVK